MSDLILCTGKLAENPYYIVGLGMNIYSIEELCFYLVRNAYIIDNDIMDEKLCDYIKDELLLPDLSYALKSLLSRKVSLGEFVSTILEMTGYIDEEELRKVKQILVDNASLSFSEKRKKRADNLLKSRKFTRAIDEYQYILNGMKPSDDKETYALILHNIGVAYAQLFMYDKAAYYFREAMELCDNRDILIHYLQSLRMTMKRETYERFVLRMGYEDSIIKEVETRLLDAQGDKTETDYSRSIEEIKDLRREGKISEYYKRIESTFAGWKVEYRDKMIVRSVR